MAYNFLGQHFKVYYLSACNRSFTCNFKLASLEILGQECCSFWVRAFSKSQILGALLLA